MPQRMCFISKEYLPGSIYGGIPRAVEMEATTLARLGVEVHVVALAPGEAATEQVSQGVVVHGVPAPPAPAGEGPQPWDVEDVADGLWSRRVASAYEALDRQIGFEVVVGADHRAETLHLARRAETRLVVWLHTVMAIVWQQTGGDPPPGARARALLELAALERADAVFAPTPLILAETAALVGDRLPPARVLPFPFDTRQFAAPPVASHAGPLQVVFSGRLEPRKGPDLALVALAAARQAGVDARLTLVGPEEGAFRRAVLDPLAERLGLHDLRYAGGQDTEGVRRHLADADVVLLPSRFDNFHMAAVEALAAGRPTVVTDRNGLAAWIGPEDGLFALPAETPQAFAGRAAAVLGDRERLLEVAPRAAARIASAFDPATAGPRLLDAYDTVAPRRPPSSVTLAAGRARAISEVSPELERFTEETPLTRRSILAAMQAAARAIAPGSRVLDVGAGNSPYRELFEHVEYLTTDWSASMHPGARSADIIASADALPVDAGSFDAVICTEVLEHVPEPAAVVAELRRVLRPGGRLFMTVPLVWELHELPHDFFRYTPGGLQHLLDGAGFETEAIVPRNDAFATIAQLMQNMRYVMGRAPDGRDAEREQAARVLASLADTVASFGPLDVQRILPLGYSVRARVPERAPIEGARRFAVVAHAEEVQADPALLAAYAERFGPGDDATLVLFAPGGEQDAVAQALGAAIARAGIEDAGGPDMLALVLPDDPPTHRRVAAGADAVLSERAPTGPLAPLPRFGRADVAALRARADGQQGA